MDCLVVRHALTLCSTEIIRLSEDRSRYKELVTLKFRSIDELVERAWGHMARLRSPFVWHARLDVDAISLAEYARVRNLAADWLDANPIPDAWIGRLVFDHFATAREADDALFWEDWAYAYKSRHGVRPYSRPTTREEAERDLVAA